MKHLSSSLLSFAILLFSPSLTWSQREMASGGRSGGVAEINVQLRYPDGSAGPRGIHVRLESAEGGSAGDCVTEEGGKCLFLPGSGGMYIVRLHQMGYKEVSVDINLVDTLRAYVNIDLKPDKDSDPAHSRNAPSMDFVAAEDLAVPENARREFEKGKSLLKQNRLDDSVSHLRKALKLYDAFPEAYTLLGTAYLEQKNWGAAEKALHKAMDLNSSSADALLALGAMFNQTQNYSQAEASLLKGLQLKPEASTGHYELAKTYWALGRWKEAAPHVRKAVTDMPDLAAPHVLLGNVLLRENNAAGALKEYQEYLRLDPNGPMSFGTREIILKIQKALNNEPTAPSH
jgi:tetratricopeptide (TPR) repeat protein